MASHPREKHHGPDYDALYERLCTSISFNTFHDVKKEVLKILGVNGRTSRSRSLPVEDDVDFDEIIPSKNVERSAEGEGVPSPSASTERAPPHVRLRFYEWFFTKIFMMYKPTGDELDSLVEGCIDSVEGCRDIVPKASYIQYHNWHALPQIVSHFYTHRFDADKYFILQLLNDTQLLKSCVGSTMTDEELRVHFVEWINSSDLVFEQRSNILDVLLRYFPRDPEVMEVYSTLRYGDSKNRKDVYSDAQNVHDSSIHQSVTQAACRFFHDNYSEEKIEKGETVNEVVKRTLQRFFDARGSEVALTFKKNEPARLEERVATTINAVCTRAAIDNTLFEGDAPPSDGGGSAGGSNDGSPIVFNIGQLLWSMCLYILNLSPETRVEILPILYEELLSMRELCSSGYIARIINVLQGYDSRYAITISFDKQLYAVLSSGLMKKMEKAPGSVVAGTFDEEHRREYLSFVERCVNEVLPELRIRYGERDVDVSLPQVLFDLTGSHPQSVIGGVVRF